uniref:Transposase, MuDR, MULE transposase domain protein n=1 Tax=Panagrellus redivivus TaxID=6233 RepID=A0A7E4UYG8_PANRE
MPKAPKQSKIKKFRNKKPPNLTNGLKPVRNRPSSSIQEKAASSTDRSPEFVDFDDDFSKVDTCLMMPRECRKLFTNIEKEIEKDIASMGIDLPDPEVINSVFDHDFEDMSDSSDGNHNIDAEVTPISSIPVVNSFYDQSESDSDDREPVKGFVNYDGIEGMSDLSDEDGDIDDNAMSDDDDDTDYYCALLPKIELTRPININDRFLSMCF